MISFALISNKLQKIQGELKKADIDIVIADEGKNYDFSAGTTD